MYIKKCKNLSKKCLTILYTGVYHKREKKRTEKRNAWKCIKFLTHIVYIIQL